MVKGEKLRQFAIFKGLTDNELENIAEIAKKHEFPGEKRIFEEKSIATHLYLLLKGKVVIKKNQTRVRDKSSSTP